MDTLATLKRHFPHCFDKNGDLVAERFEEEIAALKRQMMWANYESAAKAQLANPPQANLSQARGGGREDSRLDSQRLDSQALDSRSSRQDSSQDSNEASRRLDSGAPDSQSQDSPPRKTSSGTKTAQDSTLDSPSKAPDFVQRLPQDSPPNAAQDSPSAQPQDSSEDSPHDSLQHFFATRLSKESYGLNFLGKSYARLMASTAPHTLLAPQSPHNAENKNSQNLIIKGDNLEALKHLQNAYRSRVKAIYIDPPYNTGNGDFIYNDERKFDAQSLAKYAGIDTAEAQRILAFTLKGGATHSAWLCFMYPRLKLARELLRDDGVIFISIDDNEIANLKLLCDEIFGEEGFVNCIATKRGTKSLNSQFDKTKTLNVAFEYILVYRKSEAFFYTNPYVKEATEKQKEGLWAGLYSNADRPTMRYEIEGVTITRGQWKWNKERGLKALQNYKNFLDSPFDNLKNYWEHRKENGENLEFVRKNANGTIEYWVQPRETTIIDSNFMDLHTSGNADVKALFEEVGESGSLFSNPKPLNLLKRLLKISTSPNGSAQKPSPSPKAGGEGSYLSGNDRDDSVESAIYRPKVGEEGDLILDFFAGSGTTAHAVMALNAEDGGNRRFILVQLDEELDEKKNKAAYDFCRGVLGSERPTICDITIERVKRAAKKIKGGNPLFAEKMDLGFKVFEAIDYKGLDLSAERLFNAFDLEPRILEALAHSYKSYDGYPLTLDFTPIDLTGYEAWSAEGTLYLLKKGFVFANLKELLRRLSDRENPLKTQRIVLYNPHFDSARIRELAEALRSKWDGQISLLERFV